MSLSPDVLDLLASRFLSTSFMATSRETETFYRRDSIFIKMSQDSARRNLLSLYAIFMRFRVQLSIGNGLPGLRIRVPARRCVGGKPRWNRCSGVTGCGTRWWRSSATIAPRLPASAARRDSSRARSAARATGWPACAAKSKRDGGQNENEPWMLPTCSKIAVAKIDLATQSP